MSVAVPARSADTELQRGASSPERVLESFLPEPASVDAASGTSRTPNGHVSSYHPALGPRGAMSRAADYPVNVRERWDGFVAEIYEDRSFRVEVKRAGGQDDLAVITEFELDEVSSSERSLVRAGAPLFLIVSRQRLPRGNVRTMSSIRFRRVAAWKEDELALAHERAEKSLQQMGMDTADQ